MEVTPKVSVLMSVHNGERFLTEAIDSVLGQTFTEFEFIIIDDCSTDNTSAILQTYQDKRIKVFRNDRNIGLTKSLNIGLSKARGFYIARQDADDRSHPNRLQLQLDFFAKNPDVVLLGTQARLIDEYGNVISNMSDFKPITYEGVKYQLFFGNPFIHSTVMFNADIIKGIFGGYDEEYRFNQDFELWSRVIREFKSMNLAVVCLDFRNNPYSITKFQENKLSSFKDNLVKNVNVQIQNINYFSLPSFLEWPKMWSQLNVPYLNVYNIYPNIFYSRINYLHKSLINCELAESKEIRILAATNFYNASILMFRYSKIYSFLLLCRAVRLDYSVIIFFVRSIIRKSKKILTDFTLLEILQCKKGVLKRMR